jgi:hypothetical protein
MLGLTKTKNQFTTQSNLICDFNNAKITALRMFG